MFTKTDLALLARLCMMLVTVVICWNLEHSGNSVWDVAARVEQTPSPYRELKANTLSAEVEDYGKWISDSLHQGVSYLQIWHLLVFNQSLFVVLAVISCMLFCCKGDGSNSTKPDAMGIFDAGSQVNDLIGDIAVSFMLITHVWLSLGILSVVHLFTVVYVNYKLIIGFSKVVKVNDSEYFAKFLDGYVGRAVMVVSLFGPKFLGVLGTRLLTLDRFSLKMDKPCYEDIKRKLAKGVVWEASVQIAIAQLVLALQFHPMSQENRVTTYASLAFSVFNALMAFLEYSFRDLEAGTLSHGELGMSTVGTPPENQHLLGQQQGLRLLAPSELRHFVQTYKGLKWSGWANFHELLELLHGQEIMNFLLRGGKITKVEVAFNYKLQVPDDDQVTGDSEFLLYSKCLFANGPGSQHEERYSKVKVELGEHQFQAIMITSLPIDDLKLLLRMATVGRNEAHLEIFNDIAVKVYTD